MSHLGLDFPPHCGITEQRCGDLAPWPLFASFCASEGRKDRFHNNRTKIIHLKFPFLIRPTHAKSCVLVILKFCSFSHEILHQWLAFPEDIPLAKLLRRWGNFASAWLQPPWSPKGALPRCRISDSERLGKNTLDFILWSTFPEQKRKNTLRTLLGLQEWHIKLIRVKHWAGFWWFWSNSLMKSSKRPQWW